MTHLCSRESDQAEIITSRLDPPSGPSGSVGQPGGSSGRAAAQRGAQSQQRRPLASSGAPTASRRQNGAKRCPRGPSGPAFQARKPARICEAVPRYSCPMVQVVRVFPPPLCVCWRAPTALRSSAVPQRRPGEHTGETKSDQATCALGRASPSTAFARWSISGEQNPVTLRERLREPD